MSKKNQGDFPFPDPDKAYQDSLLGGMHSETPFGRDSGRPTERGVKTPYDADRDNADTVAMSYHESLHHGEPEPASVPFDPRLEQAAVELRRNTVIGNRFRVMKQLGHGGMGAVYLVEDMRLNDEKALKVMLPSLVNSPEAQRRFILEIKALQRLTHDGVVRVYDYGTDTKTGTVFFTMEYIQGRTLADILQGAGGILPVEEAVNYVLKLLATLQYAHKTLVHRDLKPQNIMVCPDGSVTVLDFGLAKMMTPEQMTQSNMAMGTAYYQSPEQTIRPGEVDKRADLYSVGVILYQLLAGEVPAGKIRPPSKLNPAVPRRLDNVILRCLESRPEERYSDAHVLEQAIRRALKKNRIKPYLSVAALVLLAAGAGAFLAGSPDTLGRLLALRGDSAESAPPAPAPGNAAPEPVTPAPAVTPPSSEAVETPPDPAPVAETMPAVLDVVNARSSAEQARNDAVGAQAANYSPDALEKGEALWAQGEAHLEAERLRESIAAFNEAELSFKTASTDATRKLAGLTEKMTAAENLATAAHTRAIEAGAELMAPDLFKAGGDVFARAVMHRDEGLYAEAALAFSESEKLLIQAANAVDVEARQAEVDALLQKAEQQRKQALDSGAADGAEFKLAANELERGRLFLEDHKLANASDALNKAAAGFEKAARESAYAWTERLKSAKSSVTRARNDAEAVSAGKYVPGDFEKAKTLQARAEAAESEGRFPDAKSYYDQSVKAYLASAKAAQEAAAQPAASPKEALAASAGSAVVEPPIEMEPVTAPPDGNTNAVSNTGSIRRIQLGLDGKRFKLGQRIPVRSPGGPGEQVYVWEVDGVEVARGPGRNSIEVVARNAGSSTLRLREYYNGTLHQDKTETFQIEPESTIPFKHPLDAPLSWGDNVTGLGAFSSIEWKIDGQVITTSRTLNHNFTRAGTYQIVCTGSAPKDGSDFEFRQISFSVTVN